MAKQDNKQLYIEFLKKHPNLSREQAYKNYRAEGGKIRKKTAHELARTVMGNIEKGSHRKEPVKVIKEYIPVFEPPKPKKTKPPKIIKTQGFFKVKDRTFRDIHSPAITLFRKHVDKLSGKYNTDNFLKVGMKVQGDEITQKKDAYFGIMIPQEKQTSRMGARTFSKKLHSNIKTYYTNLAKMYGDKNTLVNEVNSKLEGMEGELQKIKTKEDMIQTFKRHGFDITDMTYVTFTDKYIKK